VPEQKILGKIFKQPRHSVVQGLDVARYGDDKTASVILDDGVVVDVAARDGLSTVEAAAWGRERAEAYKCCMTVVDETGVGGGVVDEMKRQKLHVIGINYASKSNIPARYANIRDEMAFVMAEAMRRGHIGLPEDVDQRVVEDLREQRYWIDKNGRARLEEKADCKRRTGKSPDYADAMKQAWHGYVNYRSMTIEESGDKAVRDGMRKLLGESSDSGGTRF